MSVITSKWPVQVVSLLVFQVSQDAAVYILCVVRGPQMIQVKHLGQKDGLQK